MKPDLVPPVFFDTNVLVYLVSPNEGKAERAGELLRGGGYVSVQVLNELASVLRRKFRFDWPDIETVLALVQSYCEVVPMDLLMHQEGLLLARLHQLSWYDALIVAAAQRVEAQSLYSEDMQHGRVYDDALRVVNPFLA